MDNKMTTSMSKKNNTDKKNLRTTVALSLSELQMNKLKAISEKKERSMSWLVSKMVANHLDTIDLTKM